MNDEFKKKIETLYGGAGKTWLSSLPGLIKKYEHEWQLKVLSPFSLSYNYVCPVEMANGQSAVIKMSFPENKDFLSEIEALRRFPNEVSIQILKEDIANGVALLERATPGYPVSKVRTDEQQIHEVAQVLKKLHKPISLDLTKVFPTLKDWSKAFDDYQLRFPSNSGPISKDIFDVGKGIFKEFLQENKEQVLLHGDLHNDNILSSERGWLVIDPKGVIGEREFELSTFLRNPYFDLPEGSDYRKVQTNRIIQFAEELGFDQERIRLWALAGAVISLVWFLEDENTFPEIYLRNAELIREVRF